MRFLTILVLLSVVALTAATVPFDNLKQTVEAKTFVELTTVTELECPTPGPGEHPCLISCSTTTPCASGKMCCSNGCGRTCQTPVEKRVTLTCPVPGPGEHPCLDSCSVAGCTGGKMCCSNGCGRTCQTPIAN